MIAVYVPNPGHLTHIARRAGIVGTPKEEGMVLIDYEGQLYGQANLHVYADRVMHAADRHRSRYPTAARELVHEEELIRVGDYDEEIGVVVLEYAGSSKDPLWAYELVSRWLEVGRGHLPAQLKRTGGDWVEVAR